MDKKNLRLLLIAGGALALLLVITAGATIWLHSRTPSGSGFLAQLTRRVQVITGAPASGPVTAEFAFRRLEIDTSKPQAEACLVFTHPLDAGGGTHYEDYVSLNPATKVAARVVGERLCLAGLAFDKTYTLTLKTGLPDASGEKLPNDETLPVELRDKPALVRFNGGIVLPRENAAGLPVTTVNIDKLDLKVIRVGDRLLAQIQNATVDQTTVYGWDARELEQNQGALVWTGTMAVNNVKNDTVVTNIPIHDILKSRKPGAYVLIASDAAKKSGNEDRDLGTQKAAQWVIDSDIALTSFQSANPPPGQGLGLTVFARSYNDARPLSGVRLALVARNNNVLTSVTTGSDGRADFEAGYFRATGGEEPVVVMAYGANDDFSFLDLRRGAFDLTDRGVAGRATPGPIDAFLYTERGVYRPGETVEATALLRDRVGGAITAPLTLVAQRPDGVEAGRTTVSGDRLQAGATSWALALSASAPHGRWQIAAYVDPKAPPVGRVQFDVADFVPQRLKVTLTALETSVKPGGDFNLRAQANFLYGPPAAGLSGDGEARIGADPRPFEQWSGWQFGRVDDSFSETKIDLAVPVTDGQGISKITGNTGALAETTLPLKLAVKISVHEPGGRTTDKAIDIPIRGERPLIGLKPDFDGGSVAENSRAGFQIIAVDGTGKRIALSGLTYSWVREDASYQWFQSNGEWRFQRTLHDRLIASGTLDVSANGTVRLAQALPYGGYRLTVSDKSGAASSFRFYSGWSASGDNDRPDRIPVAADKPAYSPGSIAHVRIKPDAGGKALVVVAGDRVFSSRLIEAPASGATVDIPVSADWGAGAYVLVTHYRPLTQVSGREPVRSIGVAWLGIDNAPRTLSVAIATPDKVRPRTRLMVPVTVENLGREEAYLTVAAVDEGILQLTEFKSPKPVDYYFGKRRLGVNMRDDYGRLIRPEKAPLGALTQGGDSFGGRGLAVVPTRTVALFSGIVKVGADGKASVPLDIPDFNGSLRLMAVVWSGDKLGNADKMLIVRDPVVADLVLPRFLAPGDNASVALNLDNVEGAAGAYTATLHTSGPLSTNTTTVTRTLEKAQRILVPLVLTGSGLGVAQVSLEVRGPNGFRVAHDWPIEVRSPQLDIAREDEQPMAAGATFNAGRALAGDLVPSTAQVTLTVSANHGYGNVAGLLKWLDKYPYGCVEQTTSRALPLLDFNDLADLAGLPRDQALKGRIQNAIDSVLDMQNVAGDFGMWGPGEDAEPFLSVYALDFLNAAKKKGYVVPDDALRRGANWLRQTSTEDSQTPLVRAYAFYVLARAGQANLSDLRYFSDTKMNSMTGGLAPALTGAAAALMGDRSRAEAGFNRARLILTAADPVSYPHDVYGSLLRDLSGALALAAENGKPDLVPVLLEKGRSLNQRVDDTTTQEKGWMLKAAYELTRQRLPLNITVNGAPAQLRQGAVRLTPSLQQLQAGIAIANRGDAGVWRTSSVSGTPAAALPPAANGMTMTKSIWTMAGAPADTGTLHQNDRVIIEISGSLPNNLYRRMGVIDLLPAGLEIEQALTVEDGKLYPFLGKLSETQMTDKRDDRFIAAFNLGAQFRPRKPAGPEPAPQFHIAYVARAVTPGRFVLPAASASDMYAPAVTARTAMGTLSVGQ
ncbi:MAG: alpha-2-macroglobulin family protein [Alphaproteobacteria bacterium]|nr:alpha-2-macroglobulin family protein [Alphaproteobacteria bacterium]